MRAGRWPLKVESSSSTRSGGRATTARSPTTKMGRSSKLGCAVIAGGGDRVWHDSPSSLYTAHRAHHLARVIDLEQAHQALEVGRVGGLSR